MDDVLRDARRLHETQYPFDCTNIGALPQLRVRQWIIMALFLEMRGMATAVGPCSGMRGKEGGGENLRANCCQATI